MLDLLFFLPATLSHHLTIVFSLFCLRLFFLLQITTWTPLLRPLLDFSSNFHTFILVLYIVLPLLFILFPQLWLILPTSKLSVYRLFPRCHFFLKHAQFLTSFRLFCEPAATPFPLNAPTAKPPRPSRWRLLSHPFSMLDYPLPAPSSRYFLC